MTVDNKRVGSAMDTLQ